MNVVDFIESLDRIDIHQATISAVEATKEKLEELNKEQMQEGIQNDGDIIRWQKDDHYPYTKPYERKKEKAGLQVEVVDLKFSGDFWEEIEASAGSDQIDFTSNNYKTQFLEKNYSNKIFGTTDENTEKYNQEDFGPAFREQLAQQSGLDF